MPERCRGSAGESGPSVGAGCDGSSVVPRGGYSGGAGGEGGGATVVLATFVVTLAAWFDCRGCQNRQPAGATGHEGSGAQSGVGLHPGGGVGQPGAGTQHHAESADAEVAGSVPSGTDESSTTTSSSDATPSSITSGVQCSPSQYRRPCRASGSAYQSGFLKAVVIRTPWGPSTYGPASDRHMPSDRGLRHDLVSVTKSPPTSGVDGRRCSGELE